MKFQEKKDRYTKERQAHWDDLASRWDTFNSTGNAYHKRLEAVYASIMPPQSRVLEIGCGPGDLLAAVPGQEKVGIDFSNSMVQLASKRHPEMTFVSADIHDLDQTDFSGQFDIIILSDLINDLFDVQDAFANLHRFCHDRTRVVVNYYSFLWQTPLRAAQRLGWKRPVLPQNWLTPSDVSSLFQLAGFEVFKHWQEILMPLPVPGVESFCNRYLVKIWPFLHGALSNFMMARSTRASGLRPSPRVSVIVPARNEEGNVDRIFSDIPAMGAHTEVIFVEGGSQDNTYEAIQQALPRYPDVDASVYQQTGKGKGDAVRLGYAKATGDILMILDADLTVPPEMLPRFVEVLTSGKGEFVNGVRLVYPMEKRAMRFFNLLGNKFFSMAFSWLLNQPIKDSLCGTKVLWREDYMLIAANRAYFGDFDPFGDFDLLFGAAKQNLKIVDLPIRYMERTYGDTNISRWKHGMILLRMVMFAAKRIKFI
ncbi:glycosyltransferase [Desulfovibrio inopinatus]|uniref:glycosyltransferase n=1 Tax=Desulfovibrio inopinatus TaxID=102109 RepID=UPI00041584E0|nr:glycosyltransferase [Desulfovibrio inopinatus]